MSCTMCGQEKKVVVVFDDYQFCRSCRDTHRQVIMKAKKRWQDYAKAADRFSKTGDLLDKSIEELRKVLT